MIKKVIITIILIIIFAVLTAFSFWKLLPNGSVNKVQKETVKLNNYVSKTGNEIIRCIKDNDRDGISDLFCEKVKNSDYLKRKIDVVFDFINKNGILFENEDWESPYSHGSTGYSGKTVEWIYGKCKNISIGDKIYDLDFTAYEILKGHPEYEGILDIYICERYDKERLKGNNIRGKSESYLGIDLVNINYDDCSWESIIPKEFDENELYVIPNNLENGRSKW